MPTLQMKLKKIAYSGGNIGDDLNFKFEVESQEVEPQVTNFKHSLIAGHSGSFNQIIYNQIFQQNRASLQMTITITESDFFENDVGVGLSHFDLSLVLGTKQNNFIEVQVREGETIAKFTFEIEIIIESTIRYVSDVDKGWLLVKLNDGKTHPLPYQLKVKLTKIEHQRKYFIIQEGRFKDKKASVKLPPEGKSYLFKSVHTKGALLTFNTVTKKLTVQGLGVYNAITDLENPVPKGTHDLEIPYEPHPNGGYYETSSKYAKTWFRIGHNGDRFLHPGRVSLGCITVTDVNHWTKI